MRLNTLFSAALLSAGSVSALTIPTTGPFETIIKSWFNAERKALKILATTTSPKGQVIDWIPIESQGKIAAAPPLPALAADDVDAKPELLLEGAKLGPAGTVPILRKNLDGISYDKDLATFLNKPSGPLLGKSGLQSRAATAHRYGSSSQAIINYGSYGRLNIWNPYVRSDGDFSLMQSAITNNQQGYIQTVEAGWQKCKQIYGDYSVHLFVFYTTNGYTASGNNIGGYNRDVQGWVQVSTKVFPGTTFSPLSTIGGAQKEIKIWWQLFQGNWWCYTQGEWIGYYPATLFAKGGSIANTLGTYSNRAYWYGEIYDDGTTPGGGRTTTDMGSGKFPGGWQQAAFMANLTVQNTAAGNYINYDGSAGLNQDAPDLYKIQGYWNSGSNWGSYAYLGGPGAGGVTGG